VCSRRVPPMSLDSPLNRLGRRTALRRRVPTARRGALRTRRPRLRPRVVLALAAVLLLLGGGYLLLRDSGLVRVRHVVVTGVSSSAEPKIDAALETAARGMTTLHVREDVLRRAVAGFPSVAAISVHAHLPHGLDITVTERRPVAALAAGDRRLAVSGDGRLLSDVQDTIGLPAIAQGVLPVGRRVQSARTRAALAVAAAAPDALLRRAERITYGARGLTVQLVDGPPLIFGTADALRAKWLGATRVLAAGSSAGATYLDLREPGRVSAGGLGPVVAEDSQGDAEQTPSGAAAPPAATPAPYSQP
jgi:cell division protein FtsQ